MLACMHACTHGKILLQARGSYRQEAPTGAASGDHRAFAPLHPLTVCNPPRTPPVLREAALAQDCERDKGAQKSTRYVFNVRLPPRLCACVPASPVFRSPCIACRPLQPRSVRAGGGEEAGGRTGGQAGGEAGGEGAGRADETSRHALFTSVLGGVQGDLGANKRGALLGFRHGLCIIMLQPRPCTPLARFSSGACHQACARRRRHAHRVHRRASARIAASC